MADDDLDMLQQLLEMAEDDNDNQASEGRAEREPFLSGPPDQENVPANKRPRLAETAKPLAAGKSCSATKCASKTSTMDAFEFLDCCSAFQPAGREPAGPVISNAHLPAPQSKTGTVEKFSGLRVRAYEKEVPVLHCCSVLAEKLTA